MQECVAQIKKLQLSGFLICMSMLLIQLMEATWIQVLLGKKSYGMQGKYKK